MSRFDSLDRLLAHDDDFRKLFTILAGDTSGRDHLNGTSAANTPLAGGGDHDVAGEARSDVLDGGRGNDMIQGGDANWATSDNSLLPVTFDEHDGSGNNQIATTVHGAGVGSEQNDYFSLLHVIESGLPALGQGASTPVTSLAPTSGQSGSSTGETYVASPPNVTDSPPADPTPATPPRNMKQWINTLPLQHFTDAKGMQWTVAENNSGNSPVFMFVPSKFLGPGQRRG